MTRSALWKEFESGEGLFLSLLRTLVILVGGSLLIFSGVLELTWPQQAVMGLLLILLSIWLDRSSNSYRLHWR